jgi:hypothetical protein
MDFVCLGGSLLLSAQFALAVPVVIYQWDEGGAGHGVNSPLVSHHGTGGPVLADDFRNLAHLTRITQVDWWGSAAASSQWEITFHANNPTGSTIAQGLPQQQNAPLDQGPLGGISQHVVVANGTDTDGDGVFFYSTAWNLQDLLLGKNQEYWFSVANFADGWKWADAAGAAPQIGSEQFNAVQSTGIGPNAGPHFGPWDTVASNDKQDFAFRIWGEVPEPNSAMLYGLALSGVAVSVRKRKA